RFRMVSLHARLIIAVSLSSALSCHALHAQAPASPSASFDVMDATIDGIHAAMKSGSLSCVGLVESYLARIKAYDQAGPKLNAIQNVNPAAVAIAGELDTRLKSGGPVGRLHCILRAFESNEEHSGHDESSLWCLGSEVRRGFWTAVKRFEPAQRLRLQGN